MDVNFDQVKGMFGKKAKEYASDKGKTRQLVDQAINKAKKMGPLEEIWDNVQLLFKLIKDWASGNYTRVPRGSIAAMILALVYFVSPVDIIPDFLPGGIVDDAFVLGMIIKQVKSDLDKYKEWLEETVY